MLKRKHADASNMKMFKDTRRCFQQARAAAGSAQESVYSGVKQPAYTTCDNGDQQTDDVGKPQKLFVHRMPIKVCAAAGRAQESVDSGVKQLAYTTCDNGDEQTDDVGKLQKLSDLLVKGVLDKLKYELVDLIDSLVKGALDKLEDEVADVNASAYRRGQVAVVDKDHKLAKEENSLSMRYSMHTHYDLQTGPSIAMLQRAYAKLLHEAFYNKWSRPMLRKVQNFAADIVWDLRGKSVKAAEEGMQIIHKMLEHLWVEYKWGRMLKILECAVDFAGVQKASAYKRAKTCETDLLQMDTSNKLDIYL